MGKCCIKCFNDRAAANLIKREATIAACDYCGTLRVRTVPVEAMTRLFESVLGFYEITEYGKHFLTGSDPLSHGSPLARRLNDDWGVFSDRLIEADQVDRLLGDILPGIDVTDLWSSKHDRWFVEPGLDEWTRFATHIKTERRFIPKWPEDATPRAWAPDMLVGLARKLRKGKTIHRARIGGLKDEHGVVIEAFPQAEMGAPRPHPSRSGRANPPGISYLYAATDEVTAVAEMRLGRGAAMSLASLRIRRDLTVVDLTQAVPLESPLGHEFLEYEVHRRNILLGFRDELSRPVCPGDAPVEYVPTQYLTEVVLDLEYDGMLYPSALGEGKNVVVFDKSAATVGVVRLVEVTGVSSIEINDYLPP